MRPVLRLLLPVLLLVVVSGPVLAGSETADPSFTQGYANGRMWVIMNEHERLYFVIGLLNGLESLHATRSPDAEKFECNCSFGEMRDGITALYNSDSAYAQVPIVTMLRVHIERTKGATREQIDRELSDYLKWLAQGPK